VEWICGNRHFDDLWRDTIGADVARYDEPGRV